MRTLFYIASGGAVAMISMGLYVLNKTNNVYEDAVFFKEAMNYLENHNGATKFLGHPLHSKKVKFIEANGSIAKFSANVEGPSSNGTLYLWVEKSLDDEKVSIKVNRIELQLPFEKNKRLLIKG